MNEHPALAAPSASTQASATFGVIEVFMLEERDVTPPSTMKKAGVAASREPCAASRALTAFARNAWPDSARADAFCPLFNPGAAEIVDPCAPFLREPSDS